MNQNNRETVCSMRRQGYYDSIECKQVILLTGLIVWIRYAEKEGGGKSKLEMQRSEHRIARG